MANLPKGELGVEAPIFIDRITAPVRGLSSITESTLVETLLTHTWRSFETS